MYGQLLAVRSYEHVMNICVSFKYNQWWLAKEFGHIHTCLQKTQVFQIDVAYTDCRGVVQET